MARLRVTLSQNSESLDLHIQTHSNTFITDSNAKQHNQLLTAMAMITFSEPDAFIRRSSSSNSDVDTDDCSTVDDSASTTSNSSDEENVHRTKFSNNNCNNHRSFPQANQEAEHDFDFVEVNDEDGRDNNVNDIDEQPPINFAHGISPINGMNYNNLV